MKKASIQKAQDVHSGPQHTGG